MTDAATRCRLCGGTTTENLGEIPDSDYFAGTVLPEPIPGGRLFRCGACRSMFRHPILSSADYLTLYSSGVATQWSGVGGREDLRLIKSMLTVDSPSLEVLDIGCGTGDFLDSLPPSWPKFGVEPSAAAAYAERRGIKILASEIASVPEETQFDVITLIDVIEHFPEPARLLFEAYSRIRPGGKIIVSTGDPEAPMWRVLGSRFWYAGFPEHVSFPSLEFCRQWCEKRDASVRKSHTIRYQRLGPGRLALSFMAQLAYYSSPPVFNFVGRAVQELRGPAVARRRSFAPGVPGLFVDHQILIIEKPVA
jgi:SAM-dependent methyltransferase